VLLPAPVRSIFRVVLRPSTPPASANPKNDRPPVFLANRSLFDQTVLHDECPLPSPKPARRDPRRKKLHRQGPGSSRARQSGPLRARRRPPPVDLGHGAILLDIRSVSIAVKRTFPSPFLIIALPSRVARGKAHPVKTRGKQRFNSAVNARAR